MLEFKHIQSANLITRAEWFCQNSYTHLRAVERTNSLRPTTTVVCFCRIHHYCPNAST